MEWRYLTDPELMYFPQLVLGALLGFVVVALVAKRRRNFWLILSAGAVLTSGLMVGRLSYADEIMMILVLFGAFVGASVAVSPGVVAKETVQESRAHVWLFWAFMGYLIFQSIRGVVVLDSLRKGLWVGFFVMLGLISGMINSGRYPLPSSKKLSLIIAGSSALYFVLVGAYALFSETVRGISRWYLQTTELGSSAQVVFPVALAMPTALSLITGKNAWHRLVGWGTMASALIIAVYFDSRVAMLAIAGFFVVSLKRIGLRKFLLMASVILGLMIVLVEFSDVYEGDFEHLLANLTGVGSAIVEPETTVMDVDRLIYARVAFSGTADSVSHFLFGHGWRAHSTVIAQEVYDLFREYLPHRADLLDEKVAVEGFTALVVDSGVIGLAFLLAILLLVGRSIIKQRDNPNKGLLLFSLFCIFMWMFVISLSDNTLFYLAIMPQGILVQLSKGTGWQTATTTRAELR